jgi:hypothetical protein
VSQGPTPISRPAKGFRSEMESRMSGMGCLGFRG